MAEAAGRGGRALNLLGRAALAAVVLALAGWLAREQLGSLRLSRLAQALASLPAWRVAAAVACLAGSYACLALNEAFAFRYAGRTLAFRRAAPVALLVNAVANATGFGLVTGTAMRLRAYRAEGLDRGDIAKAVLRLNLASLLSGLALTGLAITATAPGQDGPLRLCLGFGLMALAGVWFVAPAASMSGPMRAAALAAALGDWSFSALGLFAVSLAPGAPAAFLLHFMFGSIAGLLAGLPGAIGPLEAAVMGHSRDAVHEAAAGLVVYRLIFLVLPLALAAGGLALRAGLRRRRKQ